MKKVLISAPYMLRADEIKKIIPELDKLKIHYDLAKVEERLEEDELVKIICQYNAIICGDDRFTRKVYEVAKNLEIIVKWGTGIDSLNEDIAKEFGIKLVRTPGAFTDPVSDTSIAMILSFVRNLVPNDAIIKKGGWDKPQGFCLSEKTIGLIGFGDIGQAVARKLQPFAATILANDIKKIDQTIYSKLNVRSVSFDEILTSCDFISVHCDLNPTSHHILNTAAFQKMKRRPYIINTARGPMIEEGSLIDALKSGQVAGAGLDVFEEEPLAIESPLRKMENVILSSHNSNSSPACWGKVHMNSIRMLKAGLKL